jgi:hypothetical protein
LSGETALRLALHMLEGGRAMTPVTAADLSSDRVIDERRDLLHRPRPPRVQERRVHSADARRRSASAGAPPLAHRAAWPRNSPSSARPAPPATRRCGLPPCGGRATHIRLRQPRIELRGTPLVVAEHPRRPTPACGSGAPLRDHRQLANVLH